jgi:hypothetical protein
MVGLFFDKHLAHIGASNGRTQCSVPHLIFDFSGAVSPSQQQSFDPLQLTWLCHQAGLSSSWCRKPRFRHRVCMEAGAPSGF